MSVSSWGLGRAAVCDCGTPWTFLLPFLPCVILFLYFSVLLALRLPRMWKTELILVLFVHLFDLRLFGFDCIACLDLTVSSSSLCLGWTAACGEVG